MTVTLLDRTGSPLAIRLFGSFEVCRDGQPLPPLRSRKGQWLLALLVLRAGQEVERAWLAGTLWPDSSEAQALANLRNSLTDLRGALGSEEGRLRSPTPRTLCLDLAGAAVDVVAFDAALAQAAAPALAQAVLLYRGPLLEGCTEEWAFQERQVREQGYLAALERLAEHALAAGDPAAAERHLRRVVAVDPLREMAQRALMEALTAGGNYAAAALTFRELRLRLHREMNAEPDPETQALYQQIRAEARGKAGGGKVEVATPPVSVLATGDGQLASGTVTFLFTDIEGSIQLWEEHPAAMRAALDRHDALLRGAIEAHEGQIFKTMGDQVCAAFATAPAALAAALAAQRALHAEPWGDLGALRVRMALHTGAAEERGGDYLGPPLNRVARLLEAGHGGQVLLSQATQELARDHLPEAVSLRDLGERRLKDLVRAERVFQLVTPDLPADFPPLQSLEAFPHNLPVQLTRFVGREQEMAAVKQRLATHPLVTLSGAGGCGKTRLALHAAADLLEEYADGVWLVELAPLADPALVPQAAAVALSLREQPGRSWTQTLAAFLKPRQLLLVLDNCEHLVGACAQLAETLLQADPQLRILATSREPLGIPGETPYRVPPLSLPDPRQLPALERLIQYEAVRLFIDRAVTALASFTVTNENAPAVAQVCQRLDGIPLAIELAAARVKALPVEQIHQRLDRMFGLLTGGSRTALPRQQTLRALIDWSYDLLSEPERVLLRRLSVFAGGWSLEAAEVICGGEGSDEGEVLDLLTQLVDKSLVQYEARHGEGRYRLLETVRQYARDRLLEAGEAAAVRERHRDWCLALAEEAEPGLRGESQTAWLDRLEREHDNLLAALEWCQEGEAERALRLTAAMGRFWHDRGYWSEGCQWLERAFARAPSAVPTVERARMLTAAGRMASLQGDQPTARARLEESIALYRVLGDVRGLIWALDGLANVMRHLKGMSSAEARALMEEAVALGRSLGDPHILARALDELAFTLGQGGEFQAARVLWQESLALARRAGDEEAMAWSLLHLGAAVERQGDWEAALDLMEQALSLARAAKQVEAIGWTLSTLGNLLYRHGNAERAKSLLEESVALGRAVGEGVWISKTLSAPADLVMDQGHLLLERGDYAAARSRYEEGLAWRRAAGDAYGAACALVEVGHAAWLQGEPGVTRTHAVEALGLFQESGNKEGILAALESLAVAALAQGRKARTGRLMGAVGALREALGLSGPDWWRCPRERMGEAVRAVSLDQAFAAAWAEGRAMPLAEAIQFAQEEAAGD